MKIYSGHYLWFFCTGWTFILFAEYFRPHCERLNVTAAPTARSGRREKVITSPLPATGFLRMILVLINPACFRRDGAFFATGEDDICVYADGAN